MTLPVKLSATGALDWDGSDEFGVQVDGVTIGVNGSNELEALGGGSGAPVGASYVTLGTDATLTSERVLTAGTGFALTDAGAGSTITIGLAGGYGLLSGLTAGRVPYVSAADALTDTAGFEYAAASGRLSVPSQFVVGATSPTSGYAVDFAGLAGGVRIARAAASSGVPSEVLITGAAHTGITDGSEATLERHNFGASLSWANNAAVADERVIRIDAPTLTQAGAGTKTFTRATTVYISGAPAAGAGVAVTNPYALWVDANHVRFDGVVYIGGGSQYIRSSGNALDLQNFDGLRINVPNASYGGSLVNRSAGFNMNYGDFTGIPSEWPTFKITNPVGNTHSFSASLGTIARNAIVLIEGLGVSIGSGTTISDLVGFENTVPTKSGAGAATRIWNARFPTGNVGMGGSLVVGSVAAAPAKTLDVQGDAQTTSHLTIGGDLNHDGSNVGFFGTAPAPQPAVGATLTNNVTAGGTANQIDDWTDLATYATDAAAIRNAVYQLTVKVAALEAALKATSGSALIKN